MYHFQSIATLKVRQLRFMSFSVRGDIKPRAGLAHMGSLEVCGRERSICHSTASIRV